MKTTSPFSLPKETLKENRLIKKTIPYFVENIFGRYHQPYIFSPLVSSGDIEVYLSKKHRFYVETLFHNSESYVFWRQTSSPAYNKLLRYELMRCLPYSTKALEDASRGILDTTSTINGSMSYYVAMQSRYNLMLGIENGFPDKPIPNITLDQITKLADLTYHKLELQFLTELNPIEYYDEHFVFIDLREIDNPFLFNNNQAEIYQYLNDIIQYRDNFCIIGSEDQYKLLPYGAKLKISSKNFLFLSESVQSYFG